MQMMIAVTVTTKSIYCLNSWKKSVSKPSNNFFLTFCFILFFQSISAQIFLRLDEYGTTDAIRFYAGDKLEIKTKEFPDIWLARKIDYFIPESGTIVFDQDFYKVEEITAVRKVNKTPKFLGNAMMQFGLVWMTYGGVLYLSGADRGISWSDMFIGLGSVISGYTLKKFASKRTYNLGSKYTLRMIDLRMVVPEK